MTEGRGCGRVGVCIPSLYRVKLRGKGAQHMSPGNPEAPMTATTPTIRQKMTALADAQPLSLLCASLLMLDKPKLNEAERLTRAVITDSICKRCPAADAAFDAWADSLNDPRTAVEVIVAAVKGSLT